MPPKKIRIKKKSVTLASRNLERMKSSEPEESANTMHMPDSEEAVLDAMDAEVSELNAATLQDQVEQRPLVPETADSTNPIDLTLDLSEPTFKFYCYRCGQKLKVPMSWAHKSTTCGRCKHDVVIPPPLVGEEEG